ncbi:MAG: acyltransferase family protein [Burkholderiales bacterium]
MPSRAPYADIPFIHLLRAIAVSMVLYDHLVGEYLDKSKKTEWLPKIWLDHYILNPFGIIQSFGFMGVALFFLVSGYIITHVASSESRREFLIKRAFRIYPPLILSVLICVLCGRWAGQEAPSMNAILLNFTLLNYWTIPQIVIQGVAWSLVIEMDFYLITLLLLTTLKRSPCLHVILQSILVGVCMATCRSLGPEFFLFCAGFAFVPYLVVGQLMYYRLRQRISVAWFIPLLLLQVGLIQWGILAIHTQFLPVGNSYLINFTFSLAIFTVLATSGIKAIEGFPKRVAAMSYSLYLLHGSIGIALMNILTKRLAYLPSLVITLAAILAAAYLSFRFVEKPSQKFARTLIVATQRIFSAIPRSRQIE